MPSFGNAFFKRSERSEIVGLECFGEGKEEKGGRVGEGGFSGFGV